MGYMGGKGNCFRRVIGAMPEHEIYIETHLGGGAVMRNKRPARRQIGIDLDADVIAAWRSRRPYVCELVYADALDFLGSFAFSGGELVYCDPPHPPETRASRQRYRHDYTRREHDRLLDRLTELPCSVMLSGADNPADNERLAGWRRIDFRSGGRRGGRAEVLWMNFEAPRRLHDPRYRGTDFRERERLKRQFATLTRRVENLPPTERAVFARWFSERFPDEVMQQREEEWR